MVLAIDLEDVAETVIRLDRILATEEGLVWTSGSTPNPDLQRL